MGEFIDKLDAAGNKSAGSLRGAAGNDRLTAEPQRGRGLVQDVKGNVEGALGDDI